ncbi:T-cell receptor alpha chain V region HPB-MLT [Sigmodon hispidus]
MAIVSSLWAVVITTCLGASMAQTVTQPQQEKSVQEAENATLDCTYKTSDTNYNLFWYKQQRGQMILVIRQEAYKQQNATENRFSVNFQKAAKSFSLEISDSQLEDAAVSLCVQITNEGSWSGVRRRPLSLEERLRYLTGTSMAQTVTQPQQEKSVQEAENATLDCTYETSDTNYNLFWYKQQRGQMILVIRQEAYKQQNATENRFSVNFQKATKSFSLEISDSQLEDAAVYFCALMERSTQ